MHRSLGSHASKRPVDNELYDRGCDLLDAAMAIRRLAADPETAPAVPALLGCIEAALNELGHAAANLDTTRAHAIPNGASADRIHRGYMNLGLAFADAELAATAARGLAARSLPVASSDLAARGATTQIVQPGESGRFEPFGSLGRHTR
jgi:hypothetical protein